MRSLPSGSWIDLEFAEAACKRIAELEAENCELHARKRDWLDSVHACLVAAGAPENIDEMESVVRSAGAKPSDFIRKRIAELDAENKQLRERLEFFEDDEYRPTGVESIQERYREASDE
jgi:hypothetical protein